MEKVAKTLEKPMFWNWGGSYRAVFVSQGLESDSMGPGCYMEAGTTAVGALKMFLSSHCDN